MTNLSDQFYRSPKNLSYFVVIGLALVAVCDLLSAALGFAQIMNPTATINLGEGGGGGAVDSVWLLLQGLIAVVKLPAFIFTVVVFLMWLSRANKNLTPLRARNVEFSPGWAVGWWFIPLANLVKPFQVVSEVWNESDPETDADAGFLSNSVGTPNLIYVWWFFWIVSNIASNASSRMFDSTDAKSLEISGYFFIAAGFLTVIAAILAIKVVRGITLRQEARFERVGVAQQFMPPPPPTDFDRKS